MRLAASLSFLLSLLLAFASLVFCSSLSLPLPPCPPSPAVSLPVCCPVTSCLGSHTKSIVVTGASRGLGRSIAHALAVHNPASLTLTYSSPSSLSSITSVVSECLSLGASSCVAVRCDVTSPPSVSSLFRLASERTGQVDVLVNNAGVKADGLAALLTDEDLQRVVDVNLCGTARACKSYIRAWLSRRGAPAARSLEGGAYRPSAGPVGRIVNVGSVVGQVGGIGQSAYSASKGGVLSLTKSLAKEFAAHGVVVNAVCPGFIDAGMARDVLEDSKIRDRILERIPAGRVGRAEEVAGMVRFLALDGAAEYITGAVFNVDGGLGIGFT